MADKSETTQSAPAASALAPSIVVIIDTTLHPAFFPLSIPPIESSKTTETSEETPSFIIESSYMSFSGLFLLISAPVAMKSKSASSSPIPLILAETFQAGAEDARAVRRPALFAFLTISVPGSAILRPLIRSV